MGLPDCTASTISCELSSVATPAGIPGTTAADWGLGVPLAQGSASPSGAQRQRGRSLGPRGYGVERAFNGLSLLVLTAIGVLLYLPGERWGGDG